MNSTIALSADERKALLGLYRRGPDPEAGRRAHILLLLGKGYTWDTIAAVPFTSASTIARWQQRFQAGGIAALAGRQPGRRQWFCWRGGGGVCARVNPRCTPVQSLL